MSSIVCYLTGLSHIDPVANDLFLGRFLNEELTALPDIDLDFPRDIREVLIPRIHDRYGRERSALVAAFPTFRSRGAIRELGKGSACRRASSNGSRAVPSRSRCGAWRRDVESALGLEPARAGPPGAHRFADAAVRPVGRRMARDGQRPPLPTRELPPRRRRRRSALPGRWAWLARLATRPTASRATSPSTRAG